MESTLSPSTSQSPIIGTGDGERYVMYKRRWFGLAAIFILNFTTSFVWLTFNAVATISANWLNAGLTEVNLTAILYSIGFLAMAPFSGYAYEKYGIKRSLIIGSLLNITGTAIRYVASFISSSQENNVPRITVILIGQFIASMSQPYFVNAPPKYAAVWFGDQSRAIAITIGSISVPIAASLAMLLIPLICKDEAGDDLPLTLLLIFGMTVIAMIPTLFMPAAPPTPPSPSAEEALSEVFKNQPFWKAIRQISTNRNFIIIWLVFSITGGLFNAFSSLINQIVTPYGYSNGMAGVFGASVIVSGVIGGGISGAIIDKTKKYRLVFRICSPIIALAYIGYIFLVRENNTAGICAISALLGIFAFAFIPVTLELGVECTYPVPPSASVSLLWMGGQLFAIIFVAVADKLRNENGNPPKNMKYALIGAASLACCMTVLVYLYNGKNKRVEAEAAKRRENIEKKQNSS